MMLENIEMLLEHRNLSIDGIFSFLKNNDNFKYLKFIQYISRELANKLDYELVVTNAFSDHEFIGCFDEEDLQLLKGYFSIMGKTDLYGQIANCKLYKEFFMKKLHKLETEENIKCKSTSTFIVGAGVLIIIVLI